MLHSKVKIPNITFIYTFNLTYHNHSLKFYNITNYKKNIMLNIFRLSFSKNILKQPLLLLLFVVVYEEFIKYSLEY